jgi:hypothetical protein
VHKKILSPKICDEIYGAAFHFVNNASELISVNHKNLIQRNLTNSKCELILDEWLLTKEVKELKQLGCLKPSEKVLMAIEMTDTCAHVCLAGIRVQCPTASEEELNNKLRKRLIWSKHRRRGE